MLRVSLQFVVLISFLVLIVKAQHEPRCTAQSMTGFVSEDFFAQPQNITLSYCDDQSGNSCCTREYSDLIGSFSDPISQSFLHVLPAPIGECRDHLMDISCVMCSPSQADWILIQPESSTLWMCQDFCDRVYNSCSLAITVEDRLVNETYTSIEFCTALFTNVSNSDYHFRVLVDQHTEQCWNDLRECTLDDYYAVFTQCTNNHRTKVYAKKPEVECNGGVPLPPSETVACAKTCKPGQRMGLFWCQNCNPGYYSLGGTAAVNKWQNWNTINSEIPFSTYCTITDLYGVERHYNDQPCGWELEGMQIASPRSLNDSMSAYLETSATLIEDGYLEFILTVDSEPSYDGLRLIIDREVVIPLLWGLSSFTSINVTLPAGYHFIQFVYYKDRTLSRGTDQAVINFVAITHVKYASDECDPCAVGTFAPGSNSTFCQLCPENTYAAHEHSTHCNNCQDGFYSLPGSSNCTIKPNCTQNDYYYLFGACYFDETENAPRREHFAVWKTPHICNSDLLPPTELVPCAPCEPGQIRETDGVGCSFCETGFYSPGDDQPCVPCNIGHEAIKSISFDEFTSLSNGLSTNCSYHCATSGWEIHEDYIDSGSGHGTYVVSNLYLEQTLATTGTISFTFSLDCTQGCSLTLSSDTGIGYRAYGGSLAYFNPTNITESFTVPAGAHSFKWEFVKNDPYSLSPNDRAIIDKITVTHTSEGGAIACTGCLPGYYNPQPQQDHCEIVSPGHYSPGSVGVQLPCVDNTYSDGYGASECKQCGENVNANIDHTACDVTCRYVDLSNTNLYNLAPLARADGEMYGPIYDPKNHTYYLNMCTLEHNQHICLDLDNNTIATYACQVTDANVGEDLGNIFGILPLRELPDNEETLGVTVHLNGGSNCHNGTVYFPRQTYIDIVCSPNAGVGEPRSLYPENVEVEKCVYDFYWESLYGCPVCAAKDYYYYTTECNEDGYKQKIYEWLENPKKCHSGVALPPTETLSCTTDIFCAEGYYLDTTLSTPDCVLAQPGYYSIGNGIVINNWDTLKPGFSSSWIQSSNDIRSNVNDSILLYVHNFVTDGYFEFTYSVNNYGDSTAGLYIFLDDSKHAEIHSTNNTFQTERINIEAGYHYVKLLFRGGSATTSESRARGVIITTVNIVGIILSADYQIPCPPGSFSATEGSTSCTLCPSNTFSHQASSNCNNCPGAQYSYPGSSSCSNKLPCTGSDYEMIYSSCENDVQTVSYQLINPITCVATSSYRAPEPVDVPCVPCEVGHYRHAGECVTCLPGQYRNEQLQACVPSSPGNAAILTTGYWNQPMSGSYFPSEFTTGCNGNCSCESSSESCNSGWIFESNYTNSGRNNGRQVDTYLSLDLPLDAPEGSVRFEYLVVGDLVNGLQFYINDRMAIIPYHPLNATIVEFELQGDSTLTWFYHQEANTNGNVILSNIVITGHGGALFDTSCASGEYSLGGSSSYCAPCAPGTSNPHPGSAACTPCGDDYFASDEGASACIPCGEGTYSNSNKTDCTTDCTFSFDGHQFDLTSLKDIHGPFQLTSNPGTGVWINICKKRSSNVICVDPTGEPIETYICEVDARGNGVDMGHYLSVNYVTNADTPYVKFTYTYAHSTACKTTINFICDPDNHQSIPYELPTSTSCSLKLEWPSSSACPICDPEKDYEVHYSACVDGTQTLTTVRASNCSGVVILKEETVDCPKEYEFSPIFVVIVVLILVALLCAVAIITGILIYCCKERNRYMALVKQNDGQYEMKTMDTSLQDDEETGSS